MRTNALVWFVVGGMLAACAVAEREREDVLFFDDIAVVDVVEGVVRPRRGVLVVGNRIRVLGPVAELSPPDHARRIDGRGKYLIPGLWDMHVHVFNQVSGRPPNEWAFPMLLAHGVTSIREMWTRPEDMGQVQLWREAVAAGDLIPRIAMAGTLVDGRPPAWPNALVVEDAAEARAAVRRIRAAGVDFVKVYSMLSAEGFAAVMSEAGRQGLSVAGHVPIAVDAGVAARAGMTSMEHLNELLESACSTRAEELRGVTWEEWTESHMQIALDSYDDQRCQGLFGVFVETGTVHVPTLVNDRAKQLPYPELDRLLRDRLAGQMPAGERASWKEVAEERVGWTEDRLSVHRRFFEAHMLLVGSMHEAGVPLMAGTDLGNPFLYPGASLLDQLELLVMAGLSPLDALRAATIVPARFAGAADSLGTIEKGRLADMVVLEENPLTDIKNVRRIYAVILNGRLVDMQDGAGPRCLESHVR